VFVNTVTPWIRASLRGGGDNRRWFRTNREETNPATFRGQPGRAHRIDVVNLEIEEDARRVF
jgi:hypothetical protein